VINNQDLYSDVRNNTEEDFDDVLIPIEDYTGSKDQPEELKAIHLMNTKEKEEYYKQHGKPKGFGSDYYTDKLPKGMSDAQYKDTKTKYRFTESFNDYKRK